MSAPTLKIALIHEVFHGPEGPARLAERLRLARAGDAELALLPELPLNEWCPAGRTPDDLDAEEPGGERARVQSDAARHAGIGLVGGMIVRDPSSGRRTNRIVLWDGAGHELAAYDKAHLPSEPGFWESDHYEPGDAPPRAFDAFGVRLGLQVCSDLNRPTGCMLLGAQGADAVIGPRATPTASYDRWRLVIRANAVTCGSYVISVNRPAAERGVEIGGPSIVAAPDGEVLVESTEPVTFAVVEREIVERARRDYPGSLRVRPELYSRGWSELG